MHDIYTKTIREIALEAPLTTRVFENYKIDFCCGGRVGFSDACNIAGVDPEAVRADVEEILSGSSTENDNTPEWKSSRELIDHIVCTHHEFTRREVERLLPLADKVAGRHGELHPELMELRDTLDALASELVVHMKKEEMILFPYIAKLELAAGANRNLPFAPFGSVNNPVRMMMFEHDQAGEMLRKLRSLSGGYIAPEGACPSYKGLYAGLEDLEKDLHIHIHLENNILFPQAVDIEKELCFDLVGVSGSDALPLCGL